MAGLMQRGANLVARAMANGLGDSVTYWRKGKASTLALASVTRAKVRMEVTNDQGAMLLMDSEVFNIDVAALTWGTPKRADRITYGTEVFEVMAPDPNGADWERINNGQTYKVFAKKVA